MHVVRFTEQLDLLAQVLERSISELPSDGGPPRWLAISDDSAVGVVTAIVRPDQRTFLSFRGKDRAAYGALITAAVADLDKPLFVTVDEADRPALAELKSLGFEPDLVTETYQIPFAEALRRLRRAWVPSGFAIRQADEVDEDRLFELDNAVRNDVPGTDGWLGNRAWFDEELHEDQAYEPAGYLVAIHESGAYAGLSRIWRNPNGPRFGLIGVRREYRGTVLATGLLERSLTAASQWGFDSFTTESGNPIVLRALARIGTEPLRRTLHMVKR